MFIYEVSNRRQLVTPKPPIRRQRDRIEPELRIPSCARTFRRLQVPNTVTDAPSVRIKLEAAINDVSRCDSHTAICNK
jgi:hypothetical protein